jgi:type IV pilus assembly protein PilC
MTFWLIIVGLGIIGMTKPGYRAYREIGFRLPGIGGMMRNINLARFCRVFGLQYAAGIPVLEGLEVSKEVLQDAALERAIEGMRKRINDGMDLRDAMLAAGVFPRRVVSMVGVGERAGGVDLMLEKLAEYYDLDVQTGSAVLTTLIWFLFYMLVLITGAIIVISAWGHYFGMIGQLINET